MMRIYLVLLLLLVATTAMFAQSKEEKEVATAVEKMRKAMVDANVSDLRDIAAEELSYGHSSATIENKAEFIKALESGSSDFVSINLSDQTIRIIENNAIVRHKLSGETNNGGKPGTVNLGVLLVWQKQKGQWKLLARQAYKL